jgi:hypothetical protein
MNLRKILLATGLFIFPAHNTLFAWGNVGHRIVSRVAAELTDDGMKTFYGINSVTLQRLVNVPDGVWKKNPSERYQHFFQWDIYLKTALAENMPTDLAKALQLVGKEVLTENGTAVWRTQQLYDLLVTALKNRDWSLSLQLAGVIGHYIGDLSQPMHVTADYDGQSIGRPGVHRYFESTILNSQNEDELFQRVLDASRSIGKAAGNTPIALTFEEGKRALAVLPEVLAKLDTDTPDEAGLLEIAISRMADGAMSLKTIWHNALRDSGICRDFPTTQTDVVDPEWVPVAVVKR